MDADKYTRNIALLCPTCGHKDFEFEADDGPIRCVSCDRSFTREELIRENGEVIQAGVDEMGAEVVADLTKELRATLGSAFRSSKNIKFK